MAYVGYLVLVICQVETCVDSEVVATTCWQDDAIQL